MKTDYVVVVGAGLAGSEAAYQLALRGIKVRLYEMKPQKFTECHKSENFAELVCSNSLGSNNIDNASGLMKEELRKMESLIINIADKTKVPAGQALAVDRDEFSKLITNEIKKNKNIEIICEELVKIPKDRYVIIATGPLTTENLSKEIQKLTKDEYLYFYDAASPIVIKKTIDMNNAYFQSRYNHGEGEYINCPMTKDEYDIFYEALITGERAKLKYFEKEKLFDACMPVEKIGMSGYKSLLFGPLKPKGLINPKTNCEDYAVVQLRQDDKEGKLYNLVGFQTNLKWGEQKRIFSLIPALKNAEYVRYGVMHRNTFINSTKLLNRELSLKKQDNIYFVGQITGSEGYVCAIGTGAYVGINLANKLQNKNKLELDNTTMLGAIINYITEEKSKFQPIGPNFGIIKDLEIKIKDKKEKYKMYAKRSLEYMEKILKSKE